MGKLSNDALRHMTASEKEDIRAKMVDLRTNDNMSFAQMSADLHLSPKILSDIEKDPEYLRRIAQRHISEHLHREGEMFTALVNKAANGDLKAFDMWMKISGRDKIVSAIDKVKDPIIKKSQVNETREDDEYRKAIEQANMDSPVNCTG